MIKRFSFFITLLILICWTSGAQNFNQHGFEAKGLKHIFFSGNLGQQPFIIQAENGDLVLKGKTSKAAKWEYSGTNVCYAEFSKLQKDGNYSFSVGDDLKFNFQIKHGIYGVVGSAIIKSFYHARASMPIEEKYAGAYSRKAGHPDNAVMIHASAASAERPEGSLISSPGGWYDAGDYNKYIVNSSITVFTMLHFLESHPDYSKNLKTDIPESENELPDVLDETLYNLRWMMSMQDPHDGGVYHKLTSKKFCAMVMPEKDKTQRYVVMKSTAATLDFSAVMAKAARVLKPFKNQMPGLLDSCRIAAEMAWEWSLSHPDILYAQPDDIKTGQYGDKDLSDEWFLAGVENFLTTKNMTYMEHVHFDDEKFQLPQWGKVNSLALYSLQNIEDEKLLRSIGLWKKSIFSQADKLLAEYKNSAYRISIKKFPWGSNSVLSNQGILLLHAYQLSNNKDYLDAADACANYILGANPTGYCFVTGFGTKRGMNVHERRSIADGIHEPVPGMLIGGPGISAKHDCGEENYPSKYPALSYLDKECSFSTNEIAINWSAAATYLFLALDAVYANEN